jgi:hypothetical protein
MDCTSLDVYPQRIEVHRLIAAAQFLFRSASTPAPQRMPINLSIYLSI